MSLLLAIDAATPQSVVVVGVPGDDAPLALGEELARGTQASETLAERIREAVTRAGARTRDVTALAVGRGPGTFTGARVAVATAKGLALGLSLDLHPFSTLEAIALDPVARLPDAPDREAVPRHVLATLDARKGEVYGAWYAIDPNTFGLTPVGDEAVAPLSRFLESGPAQPPADQSLLTGSGLRTDPAAIEGVPPALLHDLPGTTAAGVWAAANAALARPAVPTAALDVTYLRRSYAELGIHPPRRVVSPSPFV